jgi:hypothetical protein
VNIGLVLTILGLTSFAPGLPGHNAQQPAVTETRRQQTPTRVDSPRGAASRPSLQDSHQSAPESEASRYVFNPTRELIIGIIMAVVAALIYDRLKRRIRVRFIAKSKPGTVDEVHNLYLHRIDPTERVSPAYLTNCLSTSGSCARSARQFLSDSRRGRLPKMLHILVVATCHGDVVGLIKATYVDSVRMLFIAYAAIHSSEASVERRAMRKMLNKLAKLTVADGPVDWITFELTNSDSSSAAAKARLFRQQAQTLGVVLRRVDVEYLQPDLDCAKLDDLHEESAQLYIGSTRGPVRQIDSGVLRRLVDAIFIDIYLGSWMIDHEPTDEPGLRAYADQLASRVVPTVGSHIELN